MSGTVRLVRIAIKYKFPYNDWGITFDWDVSWSFNNDFARNIVIFGVDKSTSFYTDNGNNNFLVLGKGPIQGINDYTGAAEKKIVLT